MRKRKIARANERNVSLYSFPNHVGALGMQNLTDTREVLMVLKQASATRNRSIKLAGVHSINKSYSSSKDITRLSTEAHYQALKYYRSHNDYAESENSLY